ncbi:hypothetical protein WJ978_22065 [Achromobacter xylosoxidans]
MTDTERKLRNLGLVLPEDFVLHLPLRYEDETRVIPISQLRPASPARSKARSPNPKCSTGRVASSPPPWRTTAANCNCAG